MAPIEASRRPAGPHTAGFLHFLFAVLGVVLAGLPTPALGQGWIEPLRPGPGWGVERVASEVRVVVDGRVARVEVTEWFRNGGGGIAEGHYLYPLPGEASFSSFSLFQGDEELRGETLDAAEARRIYEDIVRRVRDPALIELAGQGLLRARVFPIQPGETRKVILRYEQLLAGSGGGLRFSLPGREPGAGAPAPVNPEILPQPRSRAPPGPPFRPWREGACSSSGAGGSALPAGPPPDSPSSSWWRRRGLPGALLPHPPGCGGAGPGPGAGPLGRGPGGGVHPLPPLLPGAHRDVAGHPPPLRRGGVGDAGAEPGAAELEDPEPRD
jgi:hypothetical protein